MGTENNVGQRFWSNSSEAGDKEISIWFNQSHILPIVLSRFLRVFVLIPTVLKIILNISYQTLNIPLNSFILHASFPLSFKALSKGVEGLGSNVFAASPSMYLRHSHNDERNPTATESPGNAAEVVRKMASANAIAQDSWKSIISQSCAYWSHFLSYHAAPSVLCTFRPAAVGPRQTPEEDELVWCVKSCGHSTFSFAAFTESLTDVSPGLSFSHQMLMDLNLTFLSVMRPDLLLEVGKVTRILCILSRRNYNPSEQIVRAPWNPDILLLVLHLSITCSHADTLLQSDSALGNYSTFRGDGHNFQNLNLCKSANNWASAIWMLHYSSCIIIVWSNHLT